MSRYKPLPTYIMEGYLRERDGDECYLCGEDVGTGPTIDHIVPHGKGGTRHPDNLRLTHYACNEAKGPHLAPRRIRPSPPHHIFNESPTAAWARLLEPEHIPYLKRAANFRPKDLLGRRPA